MVTINAFSTTNKHHIIYYVESKTKERKEIYYTIVNTNIKVEKIHPGYLIPTIDTIRDIKIDKIIN